MKGLNGFKSFESSDELPENVVKSIQKQNGMKYPGSWITNASYQRGKDFIVTTDDGAFYKVGAEYMVWTFINGEFGSQAIWSGKALGRTLESFMKEGKRTSDPDYQS